MAIAVLIGIGFGWQKSHEMSACTRPRCHFTVLMAPRSGTSEALPFLEGHAPVNCSWRQCGAVSAVAHGT